MKKFRVIMNMPVIVEVVDPQVNDQVFDEIFNYFTYIDEKFSPFKKNSELTKINQGLIQKTDWSRDMKTVFMLCEYTKNETFGYFNIEKNREFDPLGLVKGWAINNAANILKDKGFKNYYVEVGGDIQVAGKNKDNNLWRIGIQNPFNLKQNVKIVLLDNHGIATSGNYLRGQHIRNPFFPKNNIVDMVSLTVIGPNIYEADRFATAAFAMGSNGLNFIAGLKGLEGYAVNKQGLASYTDGFKNYVYDHENTN